MASGIFLVKLDLSAQRLLSKSEKQISRLLTLNGRSAIRAQTERSPWALCCPGGALELCPGAGKTTLRCFVGPFAWGVFSGFCTWKQRLHSSHILGV